MNSTNYSLNTPNFQAKYILKTNVLKKVAVNKYAPKEAHIVEIDFADMADAVAMDRINHSWAKSQYAQMICSPSYSPNRRVFAITTQNKDFERPEPGKIIGMADVGFKDKSAKLRFLQVSPEILNDSRHKTRKVGTSLMRGVVSHLKTSGVKSIDWFAEQRLKPFYRKVFPHVQNKESTPESYTNLLLDL